MYDISLLDIFYEGEVMCFSPEFCKSLTGLLNDKLSSHLLRFLDKCTALGIESEEDDISVAIAKGLKNLREFTAPRASILTMHLDLKSKPFQNTTMYEFIQSITLERIRPDSLSRDEMEAIYSSVVQVNSLIPQMVDRIEARQKANFEDFVIQVGIIDRAAGVARSHTQMYQLPIKFNDDYLCDIINKNKELFYQHRESERFTQLGPIIRKQADLRTIELGMEYAMKCDDDRIAFHKRRFI